MVKAPQKYPTPKEILKKWQKQQGTKKKSKINRKEEESILKEEFERGEKQYRGCLHF